MIDLETMGTKPGCPIISIGAVEFDRYTGETGAEIEIVFDFKEAIDLGEPQGSTVEWWMRQSAQSREALLRGTTGVVEGFMEFIRWFNANAKACCVWGNGATFDISILEHALLKYVDKVPWEFWAIRDCRTIEDLATISRKAFKRDGTHHTALADAKYQVKYISAMINQLRVGDSA